MTQCVCTRLFNRRTAGLCISYCVRDRERVCGCACMCLPSHRYLPCRECVTWYFLFVGPSITSRQTHSHRPSASFIYFIHMAGSLSSSTARTMLSRRGHGPHGKWRKIIEQDFKGCELLGDAPVAAINGHSMKRNERASPVFTQYELEVQSR